MKKKIIVEYKVNYAANSALEYINLDGREHNVSFVQHKHNDYQLILINKDKEQFIVDDCMGEYYRGDILLIGRNVPHCFAATGNNNLFENCKMLHFRHELFPEMIDEIEDYRFIGVLLKKCQHGLFFRDKKLFVCINRLMNQINTYTGILRINKLLTILDILGRNSNYEPISPVYHNTNNPINTNKLPIQRVYNYLYDHFKEDITLNQIAEYSHQNASALCRAFKKETRMNIFSYLNKLRIENACKLLIYSQMNIAEIAYESGFKNLSYFNRVFKQIIGKSPKLYRKSNES